jgi:hypothetical protein
MRQQMGLSKADLVEQGRGSATGSDEMARRMTVARPFWTKTLWRAGSTDTLGPANFADRATPDGVGTLARISGRQPHHRAVQIG